METFLQLVAQDLYKKVGNDLSHTAVVFPNKRASLFFNEHLAAQSDRPLWSPTYVSISDLFRQLSPWQAGDPIRLVCELYKVFREETNSEETLDDFYFWGELLISDFDDVDKNLVEADRLFGNLQDLKDIMDIPDYLDKEQEEAIREFFQNFSIERRTELKKKFISLWDKLGTIYHRYRKNLAELGIAYEGMMYRQVMEELDTTQLDYDRYVFVGFNVLNRVEQKFFQRLQDADKAWFYWDYDVFYTRRPGTENPPYKHEAGEFILRNLKLFPNQLPESCLDVMNRPKQIRFLSAPTENAQARFLPNWMKELDLPEGAQQKENAVVLCNEALLVPVLHTLPEEVKDVNITMGFPLAQTPVYSYINALDLSAGYGDGKNPLALKSEFIMSLCEQLMGSGQVGAKEKSIIDRCAGNIYEQYLKDFKGEPPTLKDLYRDLMMQKETMAHDIALALELFTTGTLNVFSHQTNINSDNRLLCFDIQDLGENLKPVGLLVMLDAIFNRVIRNRQRGRYTHVYIDEIYLFFSSGSGHGQSSINQYSGEFLYKCWKRFRKYGAMLTGITQNVEECLRSETAKLMFANSEFLLMFNQAATDRMELAKLLNTSDTQMDHVNNAPAGHGLIKVGGAIVPFINDFPKDTELYRLMSTRPGEG